MTNCGTQSFWSERKRFTISELRERGVDIEEATRGSMFNLQLDNRERQWVHKILQGVLEASILLRRFYRGDTGALHLQTVKNHIRNVLRLWIVEQRGTIQSGKVTRARENLSLHYGEEQISNDEVTVDMGKEQGEQESSEGESVVQEVNVDTIEQIEGDMIEYDQLEDMEMLEIDRRNGRPKEINQQETECRNISEYISEIDDDLIRAV
ncbi:hypothetical protein Scep_004554 [Stephania cephalantha]|uniref:Uncharacterized protein n=1 Tax=Stephania cephalantha TaxID=152367 RepID=A0AAP0KV60_9MAGN